MLEPRPQRAHHCVVGSIDRHGQAADHEVDSTPTELEPTLKLRVLECRWVVADIPPNEVGLARDCARRSPLIAVFVQLAESAVTQKPTT
jgi:hypothetical protein